MLNQCVVNGNFGKDPERHETKGGDAFATFSLCVDRDYNNASGDKVSDWLDFIAWGKTAEHVLKYFHKGDNATVVGKAQSKKWTDQDGKTHTNVEFSCDRVYFGRSRKDTSASAQTAAPAATTYSNDLAFLEGEDEQLPF